MYFYPNCGTWVSFPKSAFIGLSFSIFLCLTVPAAATISYGNGGTHTISSEVTDYVEIYNNTTVNWIDGALMERTMYNGVRVEDEGVLNISGGLISDIGSDHQAEINLTGGGITGSLVTYGNAQFNMSGGTIYSGTSPIWLYGANTTISGGIIGTDLEAGLSMTFGEGVVDITGGMFNNVTFYVCSALVRIDGMMFNYDYGLIDTGSGTLTGFLADGTPISVDYNIVNGPGCGIMLTPEPGTVALLALGAGAVLRNKRRRI